MKEWIAGLPGWLRSLVLGGLSLLATWLTDEYAVDLDPMQAALVLAVVNYIMAWLSPLYQGMGLARVPRGRIGGVRP